MSVHSNSQLVAVAVAVLAGCSNTPMQESPAGKPRAAPRTLAAAAQPVATGVVQENESQKFGRLIKGVAGQSVYFAYDEFTIQPKYEQSTQAHAAVLSKTERGMVVLEGNADERGSREYNLALGQKRAEAVSRALKTLGVATTRIEAVSLGEEKPRAACHEEKCWSENRRVDFTYKLK